MKKCNAGTGNGPPHAVEFQSQHGNDPIMFEAYFSDDLDEPGYAYAWQDDEDSEDDLEEDHPSLSAAERNPNLS